MCSITETRGLWITPEGIDRLTSIIDNMNRYWSKPRAREMDILALVERVLF